MSGEQEQLQPPQEQERRPGLESDMTPQPQAEDRSYRGSGKLQGKVALITGGDSGIGRAVAIVYAKEGADVAICYLNEHEDANETKRHVEQEGRRCLLIAGDIGDESHCQQVVEQTVSELGKLDILVNNAAEQHPQDSIEDITAEQLERTFRTNIFAMFYLVKAALKHRVIECPARGRRGRDAALWRPRCVAIAENLREPEDLAPRLGQHSALSLPKEALRRLSFTGADARRRSTANLW